MPAVEDVPVDRLIANVTANKDHLTRSERARALGRLHLLAYLRHSRRLPVTYRNPSDRGTPAVIDNNISTCVTLRPGAEPPGHDDVCGTMTYYNSPRPEIPPLRGALPPPDRELALATDAYKTARAIDPGNLRTRIALAFVLVRAGRAGEALVELRFAAKAGLQAARSGTGDRRQFNEWNSGVVLREIVAELTPLARRPADVALALRLKQAAAKAPDVTIMTPILVPLTEDTDFAHLIDRHSPAAFDFTGQGLILRAGWPTPKAAWLVWDPQHRDRITSGFQLFGSATWVASWDNGYSPLGALDDNGDGRLTGPELDGLALWADADGDGISEPGEVVPVRQAGIAALRYDYAAMGPDGAVSPAGVTFADGRTAPTYDWTISSADLVRVRDTRTEPVP